MNNELVQYIEPSGRRLSFPIKEIIAILRQERFNLGERSYEFEIEGEIQVADIKTLVGFPYEIALTESKNGIILSTGDEDNIGGGNCGLLWRMRHSRLYLHTHPTTDTRQGPDAPSFADVGVATYTDPSTRQILAHEGGMVLFQGPSHDPLKKKPFRKIDDVRYLMYRYGKVYNVDVMGYGVLKLRTTQEMPFAEYTQLVRKFAEETRMILGEAAWDDEKGIAEFMAYINLRK